MKQRLTIIFLASAALAAAGPARAQVDVNVSANIPGIQINAVADFYQPLSPYGSWVDVSPYGRCWHPADVGADWEPYTVGHWEWTDAGWYWDSDEPWGWACCHYGDWYDAPSVGWVWIPGTEWAPAWVTWRDSDDYIGWAPCGPGRAVLDPRFFVFCDVHHFHDHFDRDRHDLIRNDRAIINRTHVIHDFHRETADIGGRHETIFANRGPGVDPIERATGQKFTARPVGDMIRQSRRQENNRGTEARQPEHRNEQRPGEQRPQAPSPTGREQQRNYQQPEQRPNLPATGREQDRHYQQQQAPRERNLQRPEQRSPQEQRPNLPPTGREQQRNFQQPTPERPQAPRDRPDVTPPSRPEQPHINREMPRPTPPAEQHREVPAPGRELPPTGREHGAMPSPHQAAPVAPPARQAPVAPHGPPDGHGHDKNRDDH